MRYITRSPGSPEIQPTDEEIISSKLSTSLENNLQYLQRLFEGCSDAVVRRLKFGRELSIDAALVYFDGLMQKNEAETAVLRPLMIDFDILKRGPETKSLDIYTAVRDYLLTATELQEATTLQEVVEFTASGDAALLIDGYAQALILDFKSWESRKVESPDEEVLIRGPKEGFTETLRFNTALLRRRLKTNRFKTESMVLGRITRTSIVICYIQDIAQDSLVNEVKKRLQTIDIDGVLDVGYLEELIEDHRFSLFPQVEHTERPDRVVGHLLEGRVAVLVDGSPWAMVVPATFPQFWNSPEDYYMRYIPSTLTRILRQIAFFATLLLPSLYVATITYHQEMIPTPLLLTIAAAREGIPFPTFLEAFLMEVTFEILREAGLRMPRAIGPAISIVGALVIGDAAVSAGLVSTPMVVVVAFTGICSFSIPVYSAGVSLRMVRFLMLIAAAFLGYFGLMIGIIFLLIHLASISSFGVPYLAPLAPMRWEDLGDILVRRPWWSSVRRPQTLAPGNRLRQA